MSLDYEHVNNVLDDLYRQSIRHVVTADEKAVIDAAIALYHVDIEWAKVADYDDDDWADLMNKVHGKREEVYAAFKQAVSKIVVTA